MILVSILLVLAPGILVWKLSGCQDLTRPRAVMKVLVAILVDALLVYLAAKIVLYILYGPVIITFSPVYDSANNASIYDPGFTFKYGILTCGLAAGWAIVKAACAALWKKWRKHEK